MKLCKLKLKNLNSFRKAIEIDFEKSPLDDASLVAITGPTGAGKTTLLDAICVALYGKTPRLSGKQNQHTRHLISHGETEGFAEVHFEANGRRYHATWSIKRKGSPKGQLFNSSGELITTKVAQEVGSILGFDFDTFKRSIMLAQGEFAAFLKADLKDRREILEKTAGIGIYNKLNDKLNEKESEARETYKHLNLQLDVIPKASRDQIARLEKELEKLEESAKELGERNRKIQKETELEKKRKEDFEKLQSSEKRQADLANQQPEIDALQAELENAQCAERLRPEKQTYDAAKFDLEKVEEALGIAATEKAAAEGQVKADQTDFDGKEAVYQTASTQHNQKVDVYRNAKLNVERATTQFAEADKRTLELADLNNQIGVLSNQLTDKESEQAELQKQIDEAQTFLDDNPLPSNRQHRLNRANVLLAQLDSQQTQLGTALTSEIEYGEKVSSLKRKIEKLSKTHAERLSKKTEAEDTLETATAELNNLLPTGTREEWTDQKQQASLAQPIAQRHEKVTEDLEDISERRNEVNDTVPTLTAEFARIEEELREQTEVCRYATEAVERCEEALRSAMLTEPINRLRHHLHDGEPCPVCGATEHPFAGVMELESEGLLQDAETALNDAKSEAQTAETNRQDLKTKRMQAEQGTRNAFNQIREFAAEIEVLRDEIKSIFREWQAIYPDDDVSSDWVTAQIEKADTAIAALAEAQQAQTAASHAYDMVAQQLDTCDTDIAREEESLKDVEKQLHDVNNTIADLQADTAATEERFWKLLPKVFHCVDRDTAVSQFNEKIEEVEKRGTELSNAQNELRLLNVTIGTDQSSLENLRQDRDDLRAEIDGHQREGEGLLNAVREKIGGLETTDEINAAIDELKEDLQLKETARDEATQQLQGSQTLLIQKRATHEHCEEHHRDCGEKLETANDAYFEKLSKAGFDSSEAHDNAFRDEAQMQALTDRIDAYKKEKQNLALEITQLKARFEESPFDPETLEQIEIEAEEIGSHFHDSQRQIWTKQEEIRQLKGFLSDREALGSKVQRAAQELERWESLKGMIGENKLFNFASTIILEQVNRLANGQLESLSSGRYQLKAEGVDDKLKLAIIDRWNADEERPVETLSGGESFLTSLALALALSDLSRGRAQLNSLFLDEGFGTLDAETLDTAITALEGLHRHGRSIFLISHVQELTRRLPVKINVKKHGDDNLDSSDGSYSSSIQIRVT